MNKNRNLISRIKEKPKTKRLVIIVVSFFLLAIVGGVWFYTDFKRIFIRGKIKQTVREKTDGLYTVNYGSLNLDEVSGNLNVTSLSVRYDSTVFEQLLATNDAPPVLFNISIPEITIQGVETSKALLGKELIGRIIEINNPVIDLIYTQAGKDSSRSVPPNEVFEQILGKLDLIKIDTVNILGAQVSTSNIKTGRTRIDASNLSISLFDVAVDSTTNVDTTRLLFAKSLEIHCEHINSLSKDKLYKYELNGLSFISRSNEILIKNILIQPTKSEDAFVNSLPYQADRFDFTLKNITLKNINYQELFRENIVADSLLLANATLKIYRDQNIEHDGKSRVGKYPHQALTKIPFGLQIKTAVLTNVFLEYKEKNAKSKLPGKVQFFHTSANISNITNRDSIIEKDNRMIAHMKAKFLNKASVEVTWVFYLNHPNGRFDLKGNMGRFAATNLNPLIKPMGQASVESGVIQKLSFDFKGTNYKMEGPLTLLYDDLKVNILKIKDDEENTTRKKGFASFFANIIVKNANPLRQQDIRVANVNFSRDTTKSLFNLAWKGMFEGVKETAGM